MDASPRAPVPNYRLRLGLVIVSALLLGVSLIQPLFPNEQPLQHAPTLAALVFLAVAARRDWLSTAGFGCVVVFVWLHILGARYIYSCVPYDDWTSQVFGGSLSRHFGLTRNHYDRFVHFCFGMLGVVPASEYAAKFGKMTWTWALLFGLFAVMALSAGYEIAEWALTIVVAPEDASAYNGQQGDPWDAQKDMALAFAGALVVLPILGWRSACQKKRGHQLSVGAGGSCPK